MNEREPGVISRGARLLGSVVLALLPVACNGAPPRHVDQSDCEAGTLAWPDGKCVKAGIQGCAAEFMDADGLCRPLLSKCPAGTIPKLDEGCVPVGIQGCAAEFIEDGLCRPSIEKCPDGMIPRFNEGCVPVGIQECANVFLGDDGLCHPSMNACPAGTFAAPRLGCVAFGGADVCGAEPWGLVEDGPDTVWVNPSFAGGDGSRDAPVQSIADAMELVSDGGRIVLAAGNYDEPLWVDRTITVEGRCASMVRIQGATPLPQQSAAIIVVGAADVVLRGLTVNADAIGLFAEHAPSLLVSDVHVQSARYLGMYATGGNTSVTLSRSLIESTLPDATTSFGGRGVQVETGAEVEVVDSAVIGSHEFGVALTGKHSNLVLTSALVEDTRPRESDDELGAGVVVNEGTGTIRESAVIASHHSGVLSYKPGTILTAENNLVEGTLSEKATGVFGMGVYLLDGAQATLTGNAILDNRYAGMSALDEGTGMVAISNLVKGTESDDAGAEGGAGIGIIGGKGDLHGNAMVGNRLGGIIVNNTTAEATITDNLVEGTRPQAGDGAFGGGVLIQFGPKAMMLRNAVIGNHTFGVFVKGAPPDPLPGEGAGTNATIADNLIEGNIPEESNSSLGIGLLCTNAPVVTLTSNAILGNTTAGVAAYGVGTVLTSSRNLVADTRGQEGSTGDNEDAAFGFYFERGASATLSHDVLARNPNVGLSAAGTGTVVTAVGLIVEETLPRKVNGLGGSGVVISAGAHATLERSGVFKSRRAGVHVAEGGGKVSFSTGLTIRESLIEDTLPHEVDGSGGFGVVCSNAKLSMTDTAIRRSLTAALLVTARSRADVKGLRVDGVDGGLFTFSDMPGDPKSAGDGVLIANDSDVSLERAWLSDCERAGVFFSKSHGVLAGVFSTDNQFGLALQGAPDVDYEEGNNVFKPSSEEPIFVDDADQLDVPDAPDAIPGDPPP